MSGYLTLRGALGSVSLPGRPMLRRDALENEREARAHIETTTRDHQGLVGLRAVRTGQPLGFLGRGSDIGGVTRTSPVGPIRSASAGIIILVGT